MEKFRAAKIGGGASGFGLVGYDELRERLISGGAETSPGSIHPTTSPSPGDLLSQPA